MKFTIITHVPHIKSDGDYFGYAPYVGEMNIWLRYVDEVIVVAPLSSGGLNPIHIAYEHPKMQFRKVNEFNATSLVSVFKTLWALPAVIRQIYVAMQEADHIHLRCPGNMGLLAAVVQICFPTKKKTAKYAGNWDPSANQPFTYKVQRWLLSNTFLTRNMQVLVYGEWPDQSANIVPFFTATYSEKEIPTAALNTRDEAKVLKDDFNSATTYNEANTELALQNGSESTQNYKFIFVGTLSKGKQPLYAIKLVAHLQKQGINASLDLYGEGVLREELQNHLKSNHLEAYISLKGNQSKEIIKNAYQASHFLILPSKSEGWPKAVAEAMFWGCVPLATPVTCVPFMVDFGNRGVLLEENLVKDTAAILQLLSDPSAYQLKSEAAAKWSQYYTVELFEEEIRKLLER